MSGWQEFSGLTPLDEPLLLWFVGRIRAPKWAHACCIGTISSYKPGKVWDGAACDYRPIEWFSHWMPLPKGPSSEQTTLTE